MPYIIDGHNLIPFVPGLNLDQLDDETRLIELLILFCRRLRKQTQVYFDNAPPGQARTQRFGAVTAHFIRAGLTADAAIRKRVKTLGRSAANWTVVSSDQAVQSAARQARCQVISSGAFARYLVTVLNASSPAIDEAIDVTLSEEDIEAWLDEFGESPGDK